MLPFGMKASREQTKEKVRQRTEEKAEIYCNNESRKNEVNETELKSPELKQLMCPAGHAFSSFIVKLKHG